MHRMPAACARRALLALTAVLLTLTGLGATAVAAQAAVTPISAGGVDWGLRASFRTYAGAPELSAGASANPDGTVHWPVTGGSYDDASKATEITFGGSAHWKKYCTTTAGAEFCLLDITISGGRVVLDADGSTLYLDVVSRDETTHELATFTDTPFAALDVSGVTPAVAGGTTTWSTMPAALTQTGYPAFGGYYAVGATLDPVTVSYTGPGGKATPAAETLTPAGSPGMVPIASYDVASQDTAPVLVKLDVARDLVYTLSGWYPNELQTFSAVNGSVIAPVAGSPAIAAADTRRSTALDPATGTLFVKTNTALAAFRWNGTGYDYAALPGALPSALGSYVLWDAGHQRLVGFTALNQFVYWTHESTGWVFHPAVTATGPGAALANSTLALTSAIDSAGRIIVAQPKTTTTPGSIRVFTAAANGSALAWTRTDVPAPAETTPDYRHVLPIAQTDVFEVVNSTGSVRRLSPAAGGGYALSDVVADYDISGVALIARDPQTGSIVALDKTSKRVVVARNGRQAEVPITGPITFGVSPGIDAGGGELWFADTATLYGPTQKLYRYDITSTSPSVTQQPGDVTAQLPARTTAKTVTFTAAGTGTPAPALQWQTRPAGSTSWTAWIDVADAHGMTLTVSATAADHGRQYRAMVTNVAGRIASAPATLTVQTAPTVVVNLESVSAVEGDDAVLSVIGSGNPEPVVTWQRRVDGFWQSIRADGDDDFVVGATELRVLGTDARMSGTQFRAQLRNVVGTTYSSVATLTVSPELSQAVTFNGGFLDWGFANRWRCYVVGSVAQGGIEASDGATRNLGTLATGSLCAGRNAGSETVRFPVRSGSYDPTTGHLEIALGGSVRFWGHVSASVPALDTRFTNLRLVADGTTGTLYADTVGSTLDDPTVVTRTGVAVVTLDLTRTGPVQQDGALAWTAISSVLAAAGVPVFGAYPAGEPFDPITVSAQLGVPDEEPQDDGDGGAGGSGGGGGGSGSTAATATTAPSAVEDPAVAPADVPAPVPAAPTTPATARPAPKVAVPRSRVSVGRSGRVTVATLACPVGGAACRVTAPPRVRVSIDGRRFWATVTAPARVAAGRTATVRVTLPSAALQRLAGRSATVRVAVRVGTTKRTVAVTLTRGG